MKGSISMSEPKFVNLAPETLTLILEASYAWHGGIFAEYVWGAYQSQILTMEEIVSDHYNDLEMYEREDEDGEYPDYCEAYKLFEGAPSEESWWSLIKEYFKLACSHGEWAGHVVGQLLSVEPTPNDKIRELLELIKKTGDNEFGWDS